MVLLCTNCTFLLCTNCTVLFCPNYTVLLFTNWAVLFCPNCTVLLCANCTALLCTNCTVLFCLNCTVLFCSGPDCTVLLCTDVTILTQSVLRSPPWQTCTWENCLRTPSSHQPTCKMFMIFSCFLITDVYCQCGVILLCIGHFCEVSVCNPSKSIDRH